MRRDHSLGTHTAETTFYIPFANFVNTVGERLKPRVHFQANPASHGAGIVDGGLFPLSRSTQHQPLPGQLPERGAVEIKPPGTPLATLAQSAQVRRYLATYGLCLITNYHQFRLLELRNGEPYVLEPYDLTLTVEDLWNLSLEALVEEHGQTLPDFLQRVMTRKVLLERPKDVAWLLASYAREARSRAATHPLAAFDGVKSALQESLGITFEGEKGEHFFLSTLIQTLFYGIFSAWVLWRRTPEARAPHAAFNWRLSADYLRLPVLRALFHAVSERGALNTVQIIQVLDHATEALNRVQPVFFTTFNDEDAVNYFYEPFLEAFDPVLRKQLGVWYTPREIVRYMVERVDHLLRTELHEPLGLASPNVQVLDPCCGTGAYLVEVLHRIERTLRQQAGDDTQYIGSDLRTAATTRIFGFEIMAAPFVIAHLQIANLLEKSQGTLRETSPDFPPNDPRRNQPERAQIFLTNALTGWVPVRHPQSSFGYAAFVEERDAAEAVKQANTILVILGNPPYNGYAGIAQIEEERDLTRRYKDREPDTLAPEGKGLNDLYIRFFRIAERRIIGSGGVVGNRDGRGIVSLISNSSWLDGFSHPTMRTYLQRNFNSIYIDNLNGDKYRTGKTTPDGHPDPSAFSTPQNREGIQTGTAITTLVRSISEHAPIVRLRHFWGTRKLTQLSHEAQGYLGTNYEELSPERLLGRPFARLLYTQQYLSWPLTSELYASNFNGIQTSRDNLLVDIDSSALHQRMKSFIAISELEMKYLPWHVRPYVYRPLDSRFLYWDLTAGFLVRAREEYVGGHFGRLSLILPKQNRVSYGGPLVSRSIVDLNCVDGGAAVFTDSTVSTSPLHGVTVKSNLSDRARYWSSQVGGHDEALVLHIVCITHTPRYARENVGALQRDWPRIPLPATAELLAHSATLGLRLADLLDPESDLQLHAEWSFLARLQLPREFTAGTPEENDSANAARFALTAGWGGAGQATAVMPRRGKAPERDWTETELTRLATIAEAQNLTLEHTLTLLGQRCVDVHLNDNSAWIAVPLHVWEYTLGGYQVLKKWLSYRELPLLSRPLREDEARYFAQVVRRIAAILLLGPALDASYAAIFPLATGLPT